jgi:hypothetical protein
MSERDIDDALRQAASAPDAMDPALLERISGSIRSSLAPVRPLPSAWLLVSGLFLICAAVALAGAAHLGLYGIHKLSGTEGALIFPALAIFTWAAALLAVGQMMPGSPRRLSPPSLLACGGLGLVAIFASLFHDYRIADRFVPQGVACLVAGLLHAVPAGLASWLLLRRGFAVNPVAAGLATGTLASLAGVTMLELHCPNLEALHVMFWHTAVIPLSALAGALLARLFARRR